MPPERAAFPLRTAKAESIEKPTRLCYTEKYEKIPFQNELSETGEMQADVPLLD